MRPTKKLHNDKIVQERRELREKEKTARPSLS